MIILQVKGWDEFFEGAKSKCYNNKSSCQMPTKHGLGYRRIVTPTDGAAMFGAWCSLIQILSRHPKPRNGYITENGLPTGKPYTPEDLELLTSIESKHFVNLFKIAVSVNCDWIKVYDGKDTTGDYEDTTGPLDLDLDLDLDSNSDSISSDVKQASPSKRITFNGKMIIGFIDEDLKNWKEAYPAVDVQGEIKRATLWLISNPKKRKKNILRFLINWFTRTQEKGGSVRSNKPVMETKRSKFDG